MSRAYFADRHKSVEWVGGSVMDVLLDSEATNGQLFLARTRMKAGDAAPRHLHTNEDEMFLILSGGGVFYYDEEPIEAGEGSVVFLPRNVAHSYYFRVDSDLLTFCTPAGIENFFRGAGHDLSTPKPDDWQLTPATMAAAAAPLGLQIIGPPRIPDPKGT